jgi:hypothetical protein
MSTRNDHRVPYPLKGGCQTVTVGGTSARTTAGVGSQTRVAIIASTTDAHYAFGDSAVTATTSDTFIIAGSEHYVQIQPGQYVAFIQNSAGGTAAVSEMAQ